MRLSSTKLCTAAAIAAATTAAAGCGGSGPSKKEFVKKADALCARTNKAHPPPKQPFPNAKAAAADAAREIQIRRTLDKQLKALDVPSSEKKAFDAYNAGTEKIIAALAKMQADAAKKDEKQYGADTGAFEKAATDREKSAIALGFRTCGRRNPVQ